MRVGPGVPHYSNAADARRKRGEGMRFAWASETVLFRGRRDVLRFLYCHEWMHWYLHEVLGKASAAETACDRFALRNFRRRVEIMFPIEDPQLQRRLFDGILGVVLADNVKARELQPDGSYRRVGPPQPGTPSIRSQLEFQNMALELCETSPISHPATSSASTLGSS